MLVLTVEGGPAGAAAPARLLERVARARGREVVRAELARVARRKAFTAAQMAIVERAALAIADRLLCGPCRSLDCAPGAGALTGTDWLRVGRTLGLDAD